MSSQGWPMWQKTWIGLSQIGVLKGKMAPTPNKEALWNWYPLAKGMSLGISTNTPRQDLCPGVVSQHKMNSIPFLWNFCFILLCFDFFLFVFGLGVVLFWSFILLVFNLFLLISILGECFLFWVFVCLFVLRERT